VNDFRPAITLLRAQKLIEEDRDAEFIALAAEAKTEQVVRCLVHNGISIHEIGPQGHDLEGFYLSLMRADPAGASPEENAPTPDSSSLIS
jgi:hypothetical protein